MKYTTKSIWGYIPVVEFHALAECLIAKGAKPRDVARLNKLTGEMEYVIDDLTLELEAYMTGVLKQLKSDVKTFRRWFCERYGQRP